MTHASFFTEAQANVRGLFSQQRQHAEVQVTKEAEMRNRRIMQEAERIARNLTSPDSHGFTPVSGEDFDSFYQAVVDFIERPDVKIYKVIERREGSPRTRNYYACQCEFGQIERHLKRHLSAYEIEHMQTFKAKLPAAPS